MDWQSAFSNQCHKLGVESFLRNGVRPSLIPVLISYFQGRQMKVKFAGEVSETRNQPGSGAQGANLGNQEFLSQTNNNADCAPVSDRYKFVDDLPTLEKMNLLSVGLASHNTRLKVPSDVPAHGQIVDNQSLKTQSVIDSICSWTNNQKMVLNEKKKPRQ